MTDKPETVETLDAKAFTDKTNEIGQQLDGLGISDVANLLGLHMIRAMRLIAEENRPGASPAVLYEQTMSNIEMMVRKHFEIYPNNEL
jgi:hypothetical protein